MARAPPFSSPSDLAEYAYCPRARFYRERYGAPPSTPAALSGVAFHDRVLRGTRRRADRHRAYWGIAAAGLLLVLVGVGLVVAG